MGKKKGNSTALPLTIERRLRLYNEQKNHEERHEILWHAWNQNKRWLTQLLQMTMMTFPTYSLHNDSHSKTVLYNMEKVLGEKRIRLLSPTDCFMLLHVAYVHDIGMCITADDREKMFQGDDIVYLLERLKENGDLDMKNAAERLMSELGFHKGNIDDERIFNEVKKDIHQRLDIYQAIIYLMQEAQRGQHGIKSREHIIDWTMDQDKLGTAFSMSGIPLRIFVWIARCAGLHTDWNFEHILALPVKDAGYTHDEIHPRFIAVMLQIGDALDLDNGRFHMFTKMVMGDLPIQSQAHYSKHQSIRQLQITSRDIMIMADCDSQQALRLIREECDNLERLLQHSSYYWSQIAPEKMGGCLPTMQNPVLMLKGKVIPKELVTSRFDISQSKAFRLLQGENVYQGKFPFMRELIQNAIDATKLQCWKEYQASAMGGRSFGSFDGKDISLQKFAEKIEPSQYAIEIDMSYGYMDQEQRFHLLQNTEKILSEKNVGVYIQIKDYGSGITRNDIANIASVGTSYQNRRAILRKMPDWLRPTGEFGIGLQSVFLFSDSFRCLTYCRNGECYRIEFNDRSNGGNGYINVEPLDPEDNNLTFGTTFQLFVSYRKKYLHEYFMSAWEGKDTFSEDYERTRPARHSLELMKQIITDVNTQIGEPLFPICFHLNSFHSEKKELKKWRKGIRKVAVNILQSGERMEEDLKDYVSWLYGKDTNENYIVCKLKNGLCGFDIESMKIYLWIDEISCAVKIGAKRLFDRIILGERDNKSVKIYYKGIYVDEISVFNDTGLIEYIDLKGILQREFLQLSRNGFTERGRQYIRELMEDTILEYIGDALDVFASKYEDEVKEKKAEEVEKLNAKLKMLIEKVDVNSNDEEIQEIKKIKEELEKIENGQTEIEGEIKTKNRTLNRMKEDEIINEERFDLCNGLWEKWLGQIIFSYYYVFYQNKKKAVGMVPEKKLWKKLQEDIYEELKSFRNRLSKKQDELMKQRRSSLIPGFMNIVYFAVTTERIKAESEDEEIKMTVNIRDNYQRSNLVKFMFPETKFMIVSKRNHNGDNWKQYLLQLDKQDGMYDCLLSGKICEKDEKGYRSWRKAVIGLKSVLESSENDKAIMDPNQQQILVWLLKNMPTIAAYSDISGNMRINIMAIKKRPFVYLNNNMLYLILERIIENYKKYGAMRFAVIAWSKYADLGITEIPKSVCRVTRGYMWTEFYSWIIMPFTGEQINELESKLRIENFQELEEQFHKIQECFSVIKYFKDLDRQDIENLKDEYNEEEMNKRSDLKKIWEEWKQSISDSNSIFVRVDQMFKFYIQELLKNQKEIDGEKLNSIQIVLPTQTDLYYELLCNLNENKLLISNMSAFAESIYVFMRKVQFIKNQNHKKDVEDMIQSYQKDVSNKYLNKYVAERTELSSEEVSVLYSHLIDDIVELIEEHENEKLKPMLNYFTEEIGYQIS